MNTRIIVLIILAGLLIWNGCGSRDTGIASYYSNDLVGRKTTGGEIYRKEALTAAHRTLPFGTRVKVTNLKNGKSVVPPRNGLVFGVFGQTQSSIFFFLCALCVSAVN